MIPTQDKSTFRVSHFALTALLMLALVVVAASWLPPGIDWRDTYRPAALAIVSGRSPYNVDIYFAAPWALLPLAPFALLPETIVCIRGSSVGCNTSRRDRLSALPPRGALLAQFKHRVVTFVGIHNATTDWLVFYHD